MGTWGTGLWSNDDAVDLRGDFRDLVAAGLTAQEATQRLMSDYSIGDGGVDDHDFWLALAAVQHQCGHVASGVVERALRIIDDPAELDRWAGGDRRRRAAVLDTLASRLARPAPAPKKLRKRKKSDTALVAGQHVLLSTGRRCLLLRVLEIREDAGGRYPWLMVLAWNGSPEGLSRAHRLPGMLDARSEDPSERLGVIALGTPDDPSDLQVLDIRADESTPAHRSRDLGAARTGMRVSAWIKPWGEIDTLLS